MPKETFVAPSQSLALEKDYFCLPFAHRPQCLTVFVQVSLKQWCRMPAREPYSKRLNTCFKLDEGFLFVSSFTTSLSCADRKSKMATVIAIRKLRYRRLCAEADYNFLKCEVERVNKGDCN